MSVIGLPFNRKHLIVSRMLLCTGAMPP